MTNMNGAYDGMSRTYLTTYTEFNQGRPLMTLQDGSNINTSPTPPWASTKSNENRAIGGCNGDSDGVGSLSCYDAGGGTWMNGKLMEATKATPITIGVWHNVNAKFKMNTISNGIAFANGQVKYWMDGVNIMNYENIILRTGARPTQQFNQFILAPYGQVVTNTRSFCMDDLLITGIGGSQLRPNPPTIKGIR
jgi:hypothetical protein